jgi:hypothetical protein
MLSFFRTIIHKHQEEVTLLLSQSRSFIPTLVLALEHRSSQVWGVGVSAQSLRLYVCRVPAFLHIRLSYDRLIVRPSILNLTVRSLPCCPASSSSDCSFSPRPARTPTSPPSSNRRPSPTSTPVGSASSSGSVASVTPTFLTSRRSSGLRTSPRRAGEERARPRAKGRPISGKRSSSRQEVSQPELSCVGCRREG